MGVQVDPYYAIPDTDRFQSFCKSQLGMMHCINEERLPGLTFEDDVLFKEIGHLDAALSELPHNWDVLYLGANVTDPAPIRFSQHLFRLTAAWTTHAVAYSPRVADFIVRQYAPATGGMFDDWLSREVLPKFNGFIVAPMICWQRKGFSDLWDRQTDYEPAFENSNNKLR